MEEKEGATLEVGKIYSTANGDEYLIIKKEIGMYGRPVYYSYPHFNHCGHVVQKSGWFEDGIPQSFGMDCLIIEENNE